eukprot:m.227996 g.227996  ORF g.227996 m.227996 type:complete len:635 (+) comp33533_c0_seq3:107-2011(+)
MATSVNTSTNIYEGDENERNGNSIQAARPQNNDDHDDDVLLIPNAVQKDRPSNKKTSGCCCRRWNRYRCMCCCSSVIVVLASVICLVTMYILPTYFKNHVQKSHKIPQHPPDQPEPPHILNTTNQLVSLAWNQPTSKDATILSYHVEMATENENKTINWDAVDTLTTRTANISNLLGSTTYCFRVNAESSVGVGNFSEPNCTHTLSPTVPSSPLDLKPLRTSNLSITLGWVAANRNGDPLDTYTVEYAKMATNYDQPETPMSLLWEIGCVVNVDVDVDLATSVHNLSQCVVNSLEQKTKYLFRVQANNSMGYGAFDSPNIQFHVDSVDATAPRPPTNVNISAAGIDALNVTWDVLNDGGAMVLVNEMQMTANTTSKKYSTVYSDFEQQDAVSQLNGSSLYCFRIRAKNSVGTGGWSKEQCFETLTPKAPDDPNIFKVPLNTSSTSITVGWSAPHDNGRPITNYTLQQTDWWTNKPLSNIYTGANTSFVSDMNMFPSASYVYRVLATNAIGESPWSAERNFSTNHAGRCGNPSDATAWKTSKSTLKKTIQSCLLGCKFNPGKNGEEACVESCLGDKIGFSDPCGSCWYDIGVCMFANCILDCVPPFNPTCIKCVKAKCLPDAQSCTGIPEFFFPF